MLQIEVWWPSLDIVVFMNLFFSLFRTTTLVFLFCFSFGSVKYIIVIFTLTIFFISSYNGCICLPFWCVKNARNKKYQAKSLNVSFRFSFCALFLRTIPIPIINVLFYWYIVYILFIFRYVFLHFTHDHSFIIFWCNAVNILNLVKIWICGI